VRSMKLPEQCEQYERSVHRWLLSCLGSWTFFFALLDGRAQGPKPANRICLALGRRMRISRNGRQRGAAIIVEPRLELATGQSRADGVQRGDLLAGSLRIPSSASKVAELVPRNARQVIRWVPAEGWRFSPERHSAPRRLGRQGYLVSRAAEEEGRSWPGTRSLSKAPRHHHPRAGQLLAHAVFFASSREQGPKRPAPDVLPDAGLMPWSKAMGASLAR